MAVPAALILVTKTSQSPPLDGWMELPVTPGNVDEPVKPVR
jgi:hypothetical protein